jgi:ATP-binding protein involved in chromosome partitioning
LVSLNKPRTRPPHPEIIVIAANIEGCEAKNSGKRRQASYVPGMDHPVDPLIGLPHDERVRSRKLTAGVATIIVDATGLSQTEAKDIEGEVRAAALKVAGVTEARIAMTTSQPHRTLIAIGSGKGGVGKSTVSANLAIALAKAGKKVGLIDADVYGPSQPTLLGKHDKPEGKDDKLIPVEAHGIRFLSLGQLVSPGHALAWRGPMATGALANLVDADWRDTELLIVDLPPGTGDVQLSLIQRSRPAGAVIVSTPQDLSLIDARRAVDLFNKTSVPVLGIVENMATYACPHCAQESHPFGIGGAEAAASEMGVPFLGRLPLSLAIREASDAGKPPASTTGPEAEAFAALAGKLLEVLETPVH